jgi:hypothetical protein
MSVNRRRFLAKNSISIEEDCQYQHFTSPTLHPNPDIAKMDIVDHEDLERFFVNLRILVLRIGSLSWISNELPRWGMSNLQFLRGGIIAGVR